MRSSEKERGDGEIEFCSSPRSIKVLPSRGLESWLLTWPQSWDSNSRKGVRWRYRTWGTCPRAAGDVPRSFRDWDKYGDDMRNREPIERMFSRRSNQVGKQLQYKHSRTANKTHLKELPSICMKKQKLCLPPLEACTGVERTLAPVEERGMRHLKVAAHTRKLHPKIHAAASPRALLGEKCMHLKKRTWRKLPNAKDKIYFAPSDTKSTSSSVASCSTSNKPYRLSHTINSSTDDAESSFVSGSLPLLPTKEAIKAETRRLELPAYRSTLLAFHAYDSISWEHEALLTNLRLALHISTDEHLLELQKLGVGSTLAWIPRICNPAADMLAKMGRDGITDSWKEVPPPNLQHLLLLEAKSEKATFGDPPAASDKLKNVL